MCSAVPTLAPDTLTGTVLEPLARSVTCEVDQEADMAVLAAAGLGDIGSFESPAGDRHASMRVATTTISLLHDDQPMPIHLKAGVTLADADCDLVRLYPALWTERQRVVPVEPEEDEGCESALRGRLKGLPIAPTRTPHASRRRTLVPRAGAVPTHVLEFVSRSPGLSIADVRYCRWCGSVAFARDDLERAELNRIGFVLTCPGCRGEILS
jgi:hypothetical protein